MSESTLVQKIRTDAEAAVAAIKEKQQADVVAIQRETAEELAVLKKNHEVALEKEKQHMKIVATSQARRAESLARQTAKREQIELAFAEFKTEFTSQSAEDYVEFFGSKVKEIVPDSVKVTAIHAPKDRLDETKKILSAAGVSGDIQENSAITAGLVIHTEDGVYDVTLERLFSEARPELELLVVEQLAS